MIHTKLFNYQRHGVKLLEYFDGRALLADEMGLGKAQPLRARIATPTGWKRMGDIQPGDRVIGSAGTPVRVTGVFPQGTKKVFAVTFNDGCVVECCDDHLWTVNTPVRKSAHKPPRTLPLSEIRKKLTDSNGNRLHFVPMIEPVKYPHNNVPLDPYLFGYLVANGCLRHGISISIPDAETLERLTKLLPPGTAFRFSSGIDYNLVHAGKRTSKKNPVRLILTTLGLMGKYAHEKEIPKCYRINSIECRTALLQGLMDGDGYASKDGYIEFNSSSKRLAKQVQWLVQSLGGVGRWRPEVTPTYFYKEELRTGRTAYGVSISLPDNRTAFRLKRKQDRCKARTKYPPTRCIVSVDYVGQMECQCISVDAPDCLYATDGFVLTHNTLQMLAYLDAHPEIKRCLVICPAYLKYNWQGEIKKHLGMRSTILATTKPPKANVPLPTTRILIINYEILYRWVPWLHKLRLGLVIADEGHFAKSRTAKRTLALTALCAGYKEGGIPPVPRVIIATGTPVENCPKELFPLLHIIRPDQYPVWSRFAREFCDPKRRPWGWDFNGASNTQKLHQQLNDYCLIRRRKEDVLQQLPSKLTTVIPLDIIKRKEYAAAEDDIVAYLKQHAPERVRGALRATALAQVGYVKRLAARLKYRSACAWVDDFIATKGKLLLFAVHKDMIRNLKKRYGKQCVTVTGDTPMGVRKQLFDKFNTDPTVRLFIGNIDAAGTGWSAKADAVAFMELTWVPAKHGQAADRAHGLNRGVVGKRTQVFWLVARDTCEERLCKLLQTKQGTADAIVDGGKVQETLNVFDVLCEVLRKGKAS